MPKKTAPLTATQVKNAKADGKELSLPDGGGLVLLVKPSGVKTWQLRYYRPASNKRTTLTVGNYPDFSLLGARTARDNARAMTIQLIDAARQVEQAQSVLSMWLEFTRDAEDANKVAAILTLLHGIPIVMDTGPGGKYEPSGIVHKGEYVFDQAATNRICVSNLEAIRKNGLDATLS
ncbi:MAG: integrase arm-type DNA-binding domain-containing protein [Pseudomonadota bacterium]